MYSGRCYGWGINLYGQLGLGHNDDTDLPQEIISLPLDIVKIESGPCSLYSIVVTKSGKCYTWGRNNIGQLGLGHTIDTNLPQEISLQNIISIACGYDHTIAVTTNNKIYAWGSNEHGQLGLGHYISRDNPQELLLPNIKIESISCGSDYTMALTTSGKLYTWGKNTDGQLGLNDTLDRNFPQEIYLKESIRSIHSGHSHALCITHNDKIYVWGYNRQGQLGLKDKVDRHTPCELVFFHD